MCFLSSQSSKAHLSEKKIGHGKYSLASHVIVLYGLRNFLFKLVTAIFVVSFCGCFFQLPCTVVGRGSKIKKLVCIHFFD